MSRYGVVREKSVPMPMVSPRPASQDKILSTMKAFGLPVVAGSRA
jgi:hypothetical protein